MSSVTGISGTRKRLALAGGAASVAAAVLAVGVATGTAGAAPERSADTSAGATAQALGLGAKEKLVLKDTVKDADGTVHQRYERTYGGLPVLGGDLVVHRAEGGKVEGVTKATKAKVAVASLTPKLAPHKAKAAALKAAKAAKVATAEDGKQASLTADAAPRKVVWAAKGKPVLAYETVVGGFQEDGTPSRLHVITDAATGKKLYAFQDIKNGDDTSQYSGKVDIDSKKTSKGFQLVDTARGGHETRDLKNAQSGKGVLLTDADDVWGDGTPANRQTAAVDAAYGFARTTDFYKDVLGRDGIRGDGVAPKSYVHFGQNYVNAFWDPDTFSIYYGDGAGGKHPLNQLDVAGHEFSHGVTEATAGLEYSGESGGLNEATSDIFGTAIEFHADNAEDKGDYLLGEKIDINGDGTPLRYQDKPSRDGDSADYWDENLGDLDVHYSSGPANHFFYLLSEGSGAKEINGVKYDSPTKDGSTVEGIGREKAVKIWYKALTSYFTSTTDYHGAREGTLKAAADLYGEGGAEVKAVEAAWAGVNVKG
ncbi:M4 family metallopeptidase [Streptomyces sp. NA04227]|uniref:M4 family metallopeptidase n=1 Tax=Streptomyces sp. NA04227 TaxID=2742136 RepID=UPI0020CA6495|nr:M4 family metallopeptidase [Streptomyces sp. NA04227]